MSLILGDTQSLEYEWNMRAVKKALKDVCEYALKNLWGCQQVGTMTCNSAQTI